MVSIGSTQKESPTSGFFSNSRRGPISTRIGAHENQHLKLFDVGMTFSTEVGSDFMFSVKKQKTENFSKFQIGPEMPYHHTKEQEKHPEPHLGLFLIDLTLSWKNPGVSCKNLLVQL